MRQMLIEYMGNGFLENIIALFKTDGTLYEFIPEMLKEENTRVRLGAAALVEDLVLEHPAEVRATVPHVAALLKHENPNVRGDAAYVLGVIKDPSAAAALRSLLEDENPGVRARAQAALEAIEKAVGTE